VSVPGRPFQHRLIFSDKARSLPLRGASERASSGLTRKHQTRLERPAKIKHSSLLGPFANYGHKKFYNIGTRSQMMLNVSMLMTIKGRKNFKFYFVNGGGTVVDHSPFIPMVEGSSPPASPGTGRGKMV
jgi:hypothetical protein